MAIRGRPIGGPSGLGQTVGHAPNARHRSSSAVYLRLQWAQPSLWCRVPVTAFRPRSGVAPPGSGRLSRRDTAARGALCWRRLRRFLYRRRPPRVLVCFAGKGPEFDAPPGSWRLSRRDAMVRAALCWRRLRRFPFQTPTPRGSGLFCRKTGLNLTSFRGSGRLFRFLAAIRVDGCGITPGRKHSRRRCPVPQPTKPPRTALGR